ncbi:TPA: hypothetical protein JBE16_12070 [Legionella pneumophila subsp. pneumophila]|uniref:hypothetical protein n=1 Tax=Legionella sp. PATHC039 TaxID=2992042 RepID=UPI001A236498|nr:hypothetical protein [Legionella sp. PATHC039]MCW8396827.1 hypothetical protein [Legionella sp. PATHC039]HAT8858137.1 hypothetical protein [Legionella pneumophila subsp. pneumophila]HAT9650295.1 hypothetical protein [Legionella pneumophila subsp. pneumophila]HAT9920921.1 hypothetical protein [Legionella pneumophila subsp. pneumophila]
MRYFYNKTNVQLHLTNSIDELTSHSFPIDLKSPEKTAHYQAVADIIFSPQYKLSLLTTRENILLGQDFIDFIAHHKLTSLNKYNGVDLLYLLALSHDTALHAGIWKLGSLSHLKATEIISTLSKLDAIDRIPLMKEALVEWKKLFLKAKFELQQEAETCPDSTRNMLSQMTLYASTKNDKINERRGQSQSDQTRLEVEREQFRLLESAYYREKNGHNQRTEMQSYYSDEEEEYNVTQQQYYYN